MMDWPMKKPHSTTSCLYVLIQFTPISHNLMGLTMDPAFPVVLKKIQCIIMNKCEVRNYPLGSSQKTVVRRGQIRWLDQPLFPPHSYVAGSTAEKQRQHPTRRYAKNDDQYQTKKEGNSLHPSVLEDWGIRNCQTRTGMRWSNAVS